MTRRTIALIVLMLSGCSAQSTVGREPMTIPTLGPVGSPPRTTLPVPTAPLRELELVECAPLGAVGTFTNHSTQTITVYVDVRYYAEAQQRGTIVWTETVPVTSVEPGATALWGSHSYGRVFMSCDASLASG